MRARYHWLPAYLVRNYPLRLNPRIWRFIPHFLFLVALLATFFVYRPGLHGPFLFDDGPNISGNPHLKIADLSPASLADAAFSVPNGLFRRPLSMASFALNYYIDADRVSPFPDAYPFKLTNLLLHLINGALLFVLMRQIAGSYRRRSKPDLPASYPDWLALAVSAAWLLHPLNLTSVLYAVQRMTSLSALFVFMGLIVYLWGRRRMSDGRGGGMVIILTSLLVFAPLATLSKENGLLLPFYMLALEVTLFRFETARPNGRLALIAFFVICAALPVLAFAAYVAQNPEWVLAGYGKRDFGLTERLMTEARVIWFYLRLIILPSNALLGMYHDDIAISRQLLAPITTLPAILGILALPLCAWWLRLRQPLVALGILIFLVGQSMESTFLPLEIAFEHRNYLPMTGILLAFFHLLLEPFHAVDIRPFRRGLAVLLIALFAADTLNRAEAWSNSFDLWSAEVEHHPNSMRANTELADLYAYSASITTDNPLQVDANYGPARQYYERAVTLDENGVNALFGLVKLNATHARPVEKIWLDTLAERLAHKAIPANVNDLLIDLVHCRMAVSCTLSAAQMEMLLRAPLVNPHVSGRARALVESALGYYFINAARDYPAAIEAAQEAISLDPQELVYRVLLISALIGAHRDSEAQEQIKTLRQLDPEGRMASEIAALEKQLLSFP
jgi:hypothetical protein